jgi:hypothetical protein
MAEADASALLLELESARIELTSIKEKVPAMYHSTIRSERSNHIPQVTSDQNNKRQLENKKEAELSLADEKLKLVIF